MSKLILFQGDSITDCDRVRTNDGYTGYGYPTMVRGELGYRYPEKYEFVNRGISGNRIVDIFARIKMDLINLKPDYLSILIGVNDVWHELSAKNGVSAEKYETVYQMLIEEVMEALPETKIMILEPFVLQGRSTSSSETEPERWDYFHDEVRKRAESSRRIAQKYGLAFVPLQEKFDEACKRAAASYWLWDGVHPTPMGHNLIMKEWVRVFEETMR